MMQSGQLDMEQLFPVRRVLNPDGTLVGEEPNFTTEELMSAYRWMVYLRTFDVRALNLSRQGRMGTFAPFAGQEACQVGSAFWLRRGKDWLFPTYRDHGSMQVMGVPGADIIRYYMGDEWGSHAPEDVNVFPISIPIATQYLHAVGIGWAAKIRKQDNVAVSYVGDGGTSPGDFHEALNFAAVQNTGTIFIINNNGYAISTPNRKQFKTKTLAQRALAYDIPGYRVDGQDILATLQVCKEAFDRAVSGGGPTLIEFLTFRYGPHTTPDDPKKYRAQSEVEAWQAKDALERMKKYLINKGLLTEEQDAKMAEEALAAVNAEIAKAEAAPRPKLDDIFDYVYATPTPELEKQRAYLKAFLAKQGQGEAK
ncbi:MAG TPA: pyruvate dehydrogenase (acetyl-transferring) E1 component subunit alpha [Symbiobacteriaceae bacterium]|nr:pyruvate dehydrogenase (acetyl-transferring) E1 component subunit alpha [Symbiobacteriaceae bacterium]